MKWFIRGSESTSLSEVVVKLISPENVLCDKAQFKKGCSEIKSFCDHFNLFLNSEEFVSYSQMHSR